MSCNKYDIASYEHVVSYVPPGITITQADLVLIKSFPPWTINTFANFLLTIESKDKSIFKHSILFINFLTEENIQHFYEINLHVLLKFYSLKVHTSRSLKYFLRFLAQKSLLDPIFANITYPHILNYINVKNCESILALSPTEGLTGKDLFQMTQELYKKARSIKLQYLTVRNGTDFCKVIHYLALFLDYYNIKLSDAIIIKWLNSIQMEKQYYRRIYIFCQFIVNYLKGIVINRDIARQSYIDLFLEQRQHTKQLKSEAFKNSRIAKNIPTWALNEYMECFVGPNRILSTNTKNEGQACYILTRFFNFLQSNNCNSYQQLCQFPYLIAKFCSLPINRKQKISLARRFLLYCCKKMLIPFYCYQASFPKITHSFALDKFPDWLPYDEAVQEMWDRFNPTLYYEKLEKELNNDEKNDCQKVLSKYNRKNKDNINWIYYALLNFFHYLKLRKISLKQLTIEIVQDFKIRYVSRHYSDAIVQVIALQAKRGKCKLTAQHLIKDYILQDNIANIKLTDLSIFKKLGSVDCDQLLEYSDKVIQVLYKFNYSKTVIRVASAAIVELAVFLYENDLTFSLELSRAFIKAEKLQNKRKSNKSSYMLIFFIVDCLIKRVEITYTKLEEYYSSCQYKEKILFPKAFQSEIDDWCNWRRLVCKVTRSTHDMDISATSRFTKYLILRELSSYKELSHEIIRDFIRYDEHDSNSGRAAYIIRIRNFIFYLASKGIVDESCWYILSNIHFQRESKPVNILTQKQYSFIKQYIELKDGDEIYLRNRLVLLFAIELSLRISDIANLKYSDFDFDKMQINVTQLKTGQVNSLPITTPIMNALIRYLKVVGLHHGHNYIFVSIKAPKKRVTRKSLFSSIIFQMENIGCAHFSAHDLRRTKASKMLEARIELQLIAEILGHSNTKTLKQYLNTDSRMHECISPFGGFEYDDILY